jgi:single-strand DNA-binding protein
MNNVAISGNLCADPDIRSTQAGKKVASFTVAINEGKDKTEFVRCVAWEKTAELIGEYCSKGDRMALTGRLQTREWEKDGNKQYTTEVIVNTFDFPPKREQSAHNKAKADGYQPQDELADTIPF